tara:strand:- start:458 stop:574 length:117 start_codon:yes stop_codon:yes gene_type:complete
MKITCPQMVGMMEPGQLPAVFILDLDDVQTKTAQLALM